ncbi:MAG: hypothetical protein JRE23_06915 [Deltaproteobacteria bacterium]|nr:hypothetical protein [Deltaproteobacteria bacterium]
MKDVKKAFETIIEGMKLPTHKTLKELIKRLESLEKIVAKSMTTTKARAKATTSKKKPTKARSVKKAAPAKKTAAKKTKKTAAKKTKKAASKAKSGKKSATERVFDVIRKSPKGITVGAARKATRLESKQASNIIFRLLKQGKIVKKDRGIYAVK